MEVYQIAILALAAFCSSVIKNGAAVGSGIFLLPVLALAFPPKLALGLGAPVMLASDLLGLRYYWKEWGETKLLLRMIAAAAVGIAVGGVFLAHIPAEAFKKGIGIFAICSALWSLFSPWLRKGKTAPSPAPAIAGAERGDWLASVLYGAVGGVATILAHAGGMVWSMYMVNRVEKRVFVGSMIVMFFLSNLIKIGAYMQLGLLTLSATLAVLAFVPLIYAGSALGNWLNRRLDPRIFRMVVLLLIMCTGAGLLVR